MSFLAQFGIKLVSNSEAPHGTSEDKPYGPDLPIKDTKTIIEPVSLTPGAAGEIDLVTAFEDTEEDVYTFINGKQHNFDTCIVDDDGDYKLSPTFRCSQQHVTRGVFQLLQANALSLVALKVLASTVVDGKIIVPRSLFEMSNFLKEGVQYSLLKNGRLIRHSDNDWKGTSVLVHTEFLNFIFDPK